MTNTTMARFVASSSFDCAANGRKHGKAVHRRTEELVMSRILLVHLGTGQSFSVLRYVSGFMELGFGAQVRESTA